MQGNSPDSAVMVGGVTAAKQNGAKNAAAKQNAKTPPVILAACSTVYHQSGSMSSIAFAPRS
jgi:hypothetical protein